MSRRVRIEFKSGGWYFINTDIKLPVEAVIDDQVNIVVNEKVSRTEGTAILEDSSIIALASVYYGQFLSALGFNWREDPHMEDTPMRVAKSWVNDLAKGVFTEPPKMTAFKNEGPYKGLVLQKDISIKSMCAHHNLPFTGIAHVAYIPGDKVIGLSKINRVADYFARRPNVQETLTQQIHDFISKEATDNKGVAVIVKSQHECVSCRGIKHESNMSTSLLDGEFYDDHKTREEFFMLIGL